MTRGDDASGTAQSHKLWGGRFSAGPSPLLERVNRSIGVDFRLWPFDIRLSQAWAEALGAAGVIPAEESRTLVQGLDAVSRRLAGGVTPAAADEDIHTLIDRLLHEEVGDPASRLHTGRSRNDQVATATRLWTMDACGRLDRAIRELQEVMLAQAERLGDGIMPAYTHLQRAQPVLAAHWMLSHFWPLSRDRQRVAAAARAASSLPLGSGAVAGSAFPISRELLRDRLGFDVISQNSVDAVADRDFVAETLFALSLVGTHLSRLSEDLILFGSGEFGFARFGDSFSTGSSMMPQKRNPDVFEIARGSAARMLGNLTTVLATLKGLPSGYNKDLQDDKRPLFDAVDTMMLVVPAVAGALDEVRFDAARMRSAVSAGLMATDLADYLVDRGVSFREAHGAVGRLVREAEHAGVELDGLPLPSFAAAHSTFGADVLDALKPERSLARRNLPGGTGPDALRDQMRAAKDALQERR
ncbi:MAG TPA: argininosuccinate lyase [Gemmatimonadaceae bacterium]|nr:argininosuccinate lyase [Gemmatimonadaceae bacterium]